MIINFCASVLNSVFFQKTNDLYYAAGWDPAFYIESRIDCQVIKYYINTIIGHFAPVPRCGACCSTALTETSAGSTTSIPPESCVSSVTKNTQVQSGYNLEIIKLCTSQNFKILISHFQKALRLWTVAKAGSLGCQWRGASMTPWSTR